MFRTKLKSVLISLSIILLWLGSGRLIAQVGDLVYETDVTRRGTSAGAMLEIGMGARAEGLGGAFVAIADDPSALYWNPAGIVNINSLSLQATKTNWFVDTKLHNIDLIVPLKFIGSALGFHLAMLDYGENPVRTVDRPEGTGEVYSANDLVAGLYFALGITDRISVGLGAKYFQQRIWHVDGTVMSADLSILYDTPFKGLRLGGTISNLGPEFGLKGRDLTRISDIDGRRDTYFNNNNVAIRLATETYPLPLLFRFGTAYLYDFNEKNSLQVALNLNHPSDNVESVDMGMEVKLLKSFYLRAGYRSLFTDYAANGLTLGGGLNYSIQNVGAVTVDYSWSDWGILANVDRFTLGLSTAF